MAKIQALDPRQKPPGSIKTRYKFYQTLDSVELDRDPDILDFSRGLGLQQKEQCKQVGTMNLDIVRNACIRFGQHPHVDTWPPFFDTPAFEHAELPGKNRETVPFLQTNVSNALGLLLVPSLIPPQTQQDLVSRLMHQCLADERHKTNVHAHYRILYQSPHKISSSVPDSPRDTNNCQDTLATTRSFFDMSPEISEPFQPLEQHTHKPITVAQFLRRKLRWMTLGGQYDWTMKKYPDEEPPPFPKDIAELVHSLFPEMQPEAAIVNLYTPGDTLSIHRDVSEDSDKGLVSISFGCDAIFVAGFGDEREGDGHSGHLSVRLRSGDAVYMTGPARFAWHGVPRVIPGTCPPWLREWPAIASIEDNKSDEYKPWGGWMSDKRINLNIRQIKD